MKHEMRLHHEPFVRIQTGKKKIETRLYDNKRQQIKVGDEITFVSRKTQEELVVTVTDLYVTETFQELFDHFEPKLFGADNKEESFSIYQFYSKEDEKKFGVVGISFNF